jgi:hypothetical protein
MCVAYWQLQVPAPVTSDRSVAFDGLAEPELEREPEFDELVERVGATGGVAGGVDPVPELLWVSGVTPTLAEVDRAGVYVATTTR